jgi:hypothetical protein
VAPLLTMLLIALTAHHFADVAVELMKEGSAK